MVHCDAVQVPNLESARWVLKIDVASLRWSWKIFRVGGEELARPIRVDDCRPVDSVSDYLNGLHWRLLRCLRHHPILALGRKCLRWVDSAAHESRGSSGVDVRRSGRTTSAVLEVGHSPPRSL